MRRFMVIGVVLFSCALEAGCAPSGTAVSGASPRPVSRSFFDEGKKRARRGDDAVAEQYFVAAWDAGETSQRILSELLPICFRGSRYTSALEYVERALRENTEEPRLIELAALLEVSLGREKSALQRLRELDLRGGLSVALHFHLGVLERGVGESERARVALTRFLEKSGDGDHRGEARRLLATLEAEGER